MARPKRPKTRVARAVDAFKGLFAKKKKSTKLDGNAAKKGNTDAEAKQARNDAEDGAGLGRGAMPAHAADADAAKLAGDKKKISDAANDQANTANTDGDPAEATTSALVDKGQASGGVLSKDDVGDAAQKGHEDARAKATSDAAESDAAKSTDAERDAARAARKKEAEETNQNIEPETDTTGAVLKDSAGNTVLRGLKKTLGGLRLGLRRLKMGHALLLAVLIGLAYFGYQIGEYMRCIRDFQASYSDVIDDDDGLEEELAAATEQLGACYKLGAETDERALCAGLKHAGPSPVAAGTSLTASSTAVPQNCEPFLRRWCRLRDAEVAFRKCENMMPLKNILDGALRFIKDLADDIIDVVAEVAEKVAVKGVEVVAGVGVAAVGAVANAAGSAVGSLFNPGLIFVLAVAAVIAFLVLRKRRGR
jgi:hypothetical protein